MFILKGYVTGSCWSVNFIAPFLQIKTPHFDRKWFAVWPLFFHQCLLRFMVLMLQTDSVFSSLAKLIGLFIIAQRFSSDSSPINNVSQIKTDTRTEYWSKAVVWSRLCDAAVSLRSTQTDSDVSSLVINDQWSMINGSVQTFLLVFIDPLKSASRPSAAFSAVVCF